MEKADEPHTAALRLRPMALPSQPVRTRQPTAAVYSAALGGYNHTVYGQSGVIAGGAENFVSGEKSAIPGGMYNIVQSSYAFAGGRKTYVAEAASGTFAWGYNDSLGNGFFNNTPVTQSYSFIIDPSDTKHYTVGIRTPAPQAALDVNGDAQFGATGTKTKFTTEGYWVPRILTNADLGGAPTVIGAVVYNSDKKDLCVATSLAVGGWKIVGSNGATACY